MKLFKEITNPHVNGLTALQSCTAVKGEGQLFLIKALINPNNKNLIPFCSLF